LTIKQFSAGGLGWLAPPGDDYFKLYTKYMFNQSKWYFILILIIALICAIKLPYKLPQNKLKWLALFWFLFPLFFAYFYSIYVSPVLQHSILIFSYPFILFFLFSMTPNNQKMVFYAVPLILVLGVIQVYAVNKFNGSNEFARFKEIAQHIHQADQKYGASNVTRAINITDSTYINYYLSRLNNHNSFVFYHNAGREDLKKVVKVVQDAKTNYFMYAWSNSDCPPEINQIIQNRFPYLIEKQLYFNSEYYLYSRVKSDSAREIKSLTYSFFQNYESLPPEFSSPISTSIDSLNGHFINKYEVMTNKIEYSSTFTKPLKFLINNSSDIVHASILVKPLNKDDDALIVFSINHGNENYFWSGLNLKSFLVNEGEWNTCYFSLRLPEIKSVDDQITIYVYNQFKKNFYIDNFSIKVEQGNRNLYGPRSDQHLFTRK
jgi:hypothetical protein